MTDALICNTFGAALVCDRPRLSPSLSAENYGRIVANFKSSSNPLDYLATSPYFFPHIDKYGDHTYHELLEHLKQVMTSLFEQGALRRVAFKRFFLPIRKLDSEIYDTLLYGIDCFIRGDHLASIYILTLQLEDLLRALLTIYGGNDHEQTRHGTTKKPLGRVLRELQPSLPPSFHDYLLWILKDQGGFNLRNSIAHGFFKISNARPLFVMTLIHLLCIITALISQAQQKRPR
jgi:hypothetical protein